MKKKLINKHIKGSEIPSDVRSIYDHVWQYISDYVRSEGFKQRMDNFLKQHSTNRQLSAQPSYVRPLQPTLKHTDNIDGITYGNGSYSNDTYYDARFTRDMPLNRPSIEFTNYSNNEALARTFAHELGHHIGLNTQIFANIPGFGKFGDQYYTRPYSYQYVEHGYPDMYNIFQKNKLFQKLYKDGNDEFKQTMLLIPSSKHIDHDARPEESYSDLMELRYLLNENGIYDSRSKEVFQKSHLDKIKSLYPEWRFFQNFDDDDIIEMMNTVAFNGDNNQKNQFKNQDGGKIIDVEGYPLVDSDSEGLTDWFKNNPNVAGMAIGSGLNGIGGKRRIVLNPNLKDPNTRNSVYMNESYRHFFDANNISLPAVTDVQREAYKGTSYEGLDRRIQETEAARYLSGDPSHHLNAKQKAQLNNFIFTYPGRTLPELEVSIEYNSKNQKSKR